MIKESNDLFHLSPLCHFDNAKTMFRLNMKLLELEFAKKSTYGQNCQVET